MVNVELGAGLILAGSFLMLSPADQKKLLVAIQECAAANSAGEKCNNVCEDCNSGIHSFGKENQSAGKSENGCSNENSKPIKLVKPFFVRVRMAVGILFNVGHDLGKNHG